MKAMHLLNTSHWYVLKTFSQFWPHKPEVRGSNPSRGGGIFLILKISCANCQLAINSKQVKTLLYMPKRNFGIPSDPLQKNERKFIFFLGLKGIPQYH